VTISLSKASSSLPTLPPKYARLRAALERSARTIEGDGKKARSGVVDLQRRAIAALQECADIAFGLAECLGDPVCPRDITCLYLGDWNRCNGCFEEQTSRFFDQADKLVNAIVVATEPSNLIPSKPIGIEPSSPEIFIERAASFTVAQERVFELLATGLPNKLIAYEIGVSEATVKAHVSAVLRKLEVRSRAQAIALSLACERARNRPPETRALRPAADRK
jgi:DNA-binding CsgD family transcriptional regulator